MSSAGCCDDEEHKKIAKEKKRLHELNHPDYHETLSDATIIRLAQIADRMHDFQYLDYDYKLSKNTVRNRFWPIAIFKMNGEDNDNFTEKLFFASTVLEKIMNYHTREQFLVQQFITSKSKSPSLIRTVVEIDHFPQIKKTQVEKALTLMEENKQYQMVDDVISLDSNE